ncbi:MAG: 7-cyano-7-deazaguanine synthase QueC [Burkholderiales bacterium]|jgi:7-cyano-7-deazaguanine synthase
MKAVVLLSGGLDSATALALAVRDGFQCHALSVNYGQRHQAELNAATRVADALGAIQHRVFPLDLRTFGGSALTDNSIDVPIGGIGKDIPVTYVPARNTIFLSLALAWAEVLNANVIVIGVNAVDYSGYPDCRPEYLQAFERMANLATRSALEGRPLQILAPLVAMSKAQIILSGLEAGVDFAMTVSCYQADNLGAACGVCDACRIRRAGFIAAAVADPTRYRQRP